MLNTFGMKTCLCIIAAIFSVGCSSRTCDRTRPADDSNRPTSLAVSINWGEGTDIRHVTTNGSPITVNIPAHEGFIINVAAEDQEGIRSISLDIVVDVDLGNGEAQQHNYHAPPKVYECREKERTHILGIKGGARRTFRIKVTAVDYFGNQRSIPNIRVSEV